MLPNLTQYELTNLALWQGRKDSLPFERFFQRIECIDMHTYPFDQSPKHPIILGFCCDEGILRNDGRIGARFGPDSIREQLAKLACHSSQHFLDAGNIVCEDDDLEGAQKQLAHLIEQCHQHGHQTIVLGGGHEIAFGHYCGLATNYPKIGIINFDAHFDIRINSHSPKGTSGTPFAQIKQYCQDHSRTFDYCCVGIQETANTTSLFERAHTWGISYLLADTLYEAQVNQQYAFLDAFIEQHTHLYLSICLDVFAESEAPGVSAPQSMGLSPRVVMPLLKYILQTGKVVSLDIAELSPPLDVDHKTARLAATVLAQLLNLTTTRNVSL